MEYKPKKREWVKNAAIIFLSVLLLLTFFSNTWMNRSLPEVATQYVQNGSITAKVRGTGTVTAVGTSTVKAEDTREIRAVMVKVGQKVEAGDVLFVLGQGEASALEAAQEQLRQLEMSYQRTAAGIAYPSYAGDERRIQDAKDEMDEAKAELDLIGSNSGGTAVTELRAKQAAVYAQLTEAQKQRDEESDKVKAATEDLAIKKQDRDIALRALTQWGILYIDPVYDYDPRWRFNVRDARLVTLRDNGEVESDVPIFSSMAAVYVAEPENYEDTLSLFGAELTEEELRLPATLEEALYGEPEALTEPLTALGAAAEPTPTETMPTETTPTETMPTETTPTETTPTETTTETTPTEPTPTEPTPTETTPTETTTETTPTEPTPTEPTPTEPTPTEQTTSLEDILRMQDYQRKQQLVDAAEMFLEDRQQNYDAAQSQVDALQTLFDGYQESIDALMVYSPDSEAYSKANAAYKTARNTYFTLLETLDEKRRSDARSVNQSYIDLTDISQQIENAKKKVAELSGGEENQVTAKVAGTVLTVECAPGDTKLKNDVLCTIEVPDMGYTLSFSVTNEQSRRLKVGDTATVSNYYWGREVLATLSNIKTDPKNPQNSKILTFDLSGDVTPGAELTLSVGQKSANYDIIIPNSAIRSDTNGSFVLRVEAKNSPLGNRYIARRVAVEVLAEDDMNSAVTGDLGYGDYVITTSNAPIKNGDMVRLADNA